MIYVNLHNRLESKEFSDPLFYTFYRLHNDKMEK